LYFSWPANLERLQPKDYLNKGGRVTVFGLKPGTPLICAVEQLAYYLDNLNTKIVIKVDSHNIDEVTFAFEKTPVKDRVSKIIYLCLVDVSAHIAYNILYLII
jgi:hypothetical protein